MGPRSRSFQRLTSHLIAFHYPRHRNFIQFGCCWCLENGWIRFHPMRTKPPGHCPQTLIEVHWRLCQYMCNKLWYESGLLPSVVSCRSLEQVSHLTVSLPERYISFARIILFFSRQGGLQPPQPPRPVRWCLLTCTSDCISFFFLSSSFLNVCVFLLSFSLIFSWKIARCSGKHEK